MWAARIQHQSAKCFPRSALYQSCGQRRCYWVSHLPLTGRSKSGTSRALEEHCHSHLEEGEASGKGIANAPHHQSVIVWGSSNKPGSSEGPKLKAQCVFLVHGHTFEFRKSFYMYAPFPPQICLTEKCRNQDTQNRNHMQTHR